MSFVGLKEKINEGDTVILFLSVNSMHPIEVVPQCRNKHGELMENKFQTVYGALNVMSLVGKKYGSKVKLTKGWAHVLHPSCELWTKTLPHRTQIIYTPDISLILLGLNLEPGSVVVEAGTGSGSLSHAIIRTVYPSGHLHTFDFHEKRAALAREEFRKHGLSEWVTVKHCDAISEGFKGVENCSCDGVFLDLPNPWDGISHVKYVLKPGGIFCTFSPCIEQVQKTYQVMRKSQNFFKLRTQEVLQRPYAVQTRVQTSFDFDQSVTPTEASTETDPNDKNRTAPIKKNAEKYKTLVSPSTIPGHTGYITFATFLPQS